MLFPIFSVATWVRHEVQALYIFQARYYATVLLRPCYKLSRNPFGLWCMDVCCYFRCAFLQLIWLLNTFTFCNDEKLTQIRIVWDHAVLELCCLANKCANHLQQVFRLRTCVHAAFLCYGL